MLCCNELMLPMWNSNHVAGLKHGMMRASWKVNSAQKSLHTDVSSVFIVYLSLYYLCIKKLIEKNACTVRGSLCLNQHQIILSLNQSFLLNLPDYAVVISCGRTITLCSNERVNQQPPTRGNGTWRKQVLIIEPFFRVMG